MLFGVDAEVGALGEVVAQETVRVFVAATLPGRVGVAEVDRDAERFLHTEVACHLRAPVPGDRLEHPRRQVTHACDERVVERVRIP